MFVKYKDLPERYKSDTHGTYTMASELLYCVIDGILYGAVWMDPPTPGGSNQAFCGYSVTEIWDVESMGLFSDLDSVEDYLKPHEIVGVDF
jgi:hypothetical protein